LETGSGDKLVIQLRILGIACYGARSSINTRIHFSLFDALDSAFIQINQYAAVVAMLLFVPEYAVAYYHANE